MSAIFQNLVLVEKGWDKRRPTLKRAPQVPQHILDLRATLTFFSPDRVSALLRGDEKSPSVWTVYGWIRAGELAAQKLGNQYKVSSYQLADFLEAQAKE